jgi:predicted lipid-binding transport protein (Tim44 family)
MKKLSGFLLSVLIAFTLLSAGAGEAYAARLGGGKSFGSRPSYSTPYSRPGNSASPSQMPGGQASAAAQRNQAARTAMGNRGGLMGMLGGLALGGLLGAMFFGGGFEGINFMDILLFGGIAFALFTLFKLFAGRRQGSPEQAATSGLAYRQALDADEAPAYQRNAGGAGRAGFNTDLLFNRNGSRDGGFQPSPATWPADFDAAGFLNGAKAAYAHLQQAWDQGDLAELRGLCTDKVFVELQEQIRGRNGGNQTELLKVEAEILEVSDVGGDREAVVLFDVMMRESASQPATPVREVWHFIRARASKQPTWFLDGIQQIED